MNTVTIKIGHESFQIKPGVIEGTTLHNLANITPPHQLVVSRAGAMDIPIASNDRVIIEGGEKFAIGDGAPPLVDNPCLRKGINFFLNGEKFNGDDALDKAKLTGTELKSLDPNSQSSDGLFAELRGFADEPIQDNWRIVVQDKDHFITVPCGNVGEQSSSVISSFDNQLAELRGKHDRVDVLPNGQLKLVVVRDMPLPKGWRQKPVDLMIQVPQSYPPAALDMFWVFPHLKLSSGAWPDRGSTFEQHAGINWQRFSWHYIGNRWNPARNTLLSHLKFCLTRLHQVH